MYKLLRISNEINVSLNIRLRVTATVILSSLYTKALPEERFLH